jgi:hypothetical protein
LQSAQGSEAKPLYAQLFPVAAPTRPVAVEIKVQEADPGGGFLGFGTRWIDCDTAPGGGPYRFDWSGEGRTVTTIGGGSKAASTTVVFGHGAPPAPVFAIKDTQPTAVTFTWDAGPSGSGHRLLGDLPGADAEYGSGSATETVEGLCQNQDYHVHLVRDLDPWHVGARLSFHTVNAPPPTPQIAYVALDGHNLTAKVNLHVGDVVRGELYVGDSPDFIPDATTLVTARQDTELNFRMRGLEFKATGFNASAGYVKVVLKDDGNLSSTSEPLAIGAPGVGWDGGAVYDCNGVLVKPAPTIKPAPARMPVPASVEEVSQDEAAPEGPEGFDKLVDSFGLGPSLLAAAAAAIGVGTLIGLALRRR